MDTIKLDSLDIALPYIARELCAEAVKLADELRGNLTGNEIQKFREEFIHGYLALLRDLLEHGMPAVGFDPFNLSTMPESMIDDEASFLQKFEKLKNSQNFINATREAAFGEADPQSVCLLLHHIEMLRQLEQKAMKSGFKNYKETIAALSSHIQSLHKLIVAHKSLPHQAKIYADNVQRKRGARKGGAAKASRMKELQEVVISEAREFHGATTATKAAQAIFEKLLGQGNWLKDDKGKSLLKDPVARFTAWIRDDRSHDHQEKVPSA